MWSPPACQRPFRESYSPQPAGPAFFPQDVPRRGFRSVSFCWGPVWKTPGTHILEGDARKASRPHNGVPLLPPMPHLSSVFVLVHKQG